MVDEMAVWTVYAKVENLGGAKVAELVDLMAVDLAGMKVDEKADRRAARKAL